MNKKILGILTIVFFIFFEVYAGIRLLTSPVEFTNNVVVIFGIVMLVIGLVSVIRALQAKSNGFPFRLGVFGGVIDLIIGVICVFFSQKVIDFFPVLVMIYGIIMVVAGINKIRNYLFLKDLGINRSWLLVLSGILTIILGVVVFLNPFPAMETAWAVTGVLLIVEGVVDLLTLIFSFFF